jgi:hypothetical protein
MSMTKPQISGVAAESPADGQPKRRLRMADAMRIEGVDESVVAKTYKCLIERKSAAQSTAQDAKLLLDTARDCVKILDPPRESDEIPANAIVQLIHSVPRPDHDAMPALDPPE